MCGKFTALASWGQVVAFSQPLSVERALGDDAQVTFRVMDKLRLLVWDPERRERRILIARWGFPHPEDWRRPQPIHARSESLDTTHAFAKAFLSGQRGIGLVQTFNEAPDGAGKAVQHTIAPDAEKTGIAFIWRKFDLPPVGAGQENRNAPALFACVMVTVPANRLIASLPADRMPAILAPGDWAKWIGEEPAGVDALKAMLKTVEGVNWTMAKEARPRSRATVSGPLL